MNSSYTFPEAPSLRFTWPRSACVSPEYTVVEDGLVYERVQYTFNPSKAVEPEAAAVHGFSNAYLQHSPSFSALASAIHEVLETGVLVGFNALRYDLPMLGRQLETAGLTLDWTDRVLDVFLLAKRFVEAPFFTLVDLARLAGLNTLDAHDAVVDVKLTWGVLQWILRQQPALACQSWQELIAGQTLWLSRHKKYRP